MDGISFALGVLPELRSQITLIKSRIDNYAQGPAKFQELYAKLSDLTVYVTQVEHILSDNPDAIPEQTFSLFRSRLESVHNLLEKCEPVLDKLLESTFQGSSSDKCKAVLRMFRRVARANNVSDRMSLVESQINEACAIFYTLVSELSVCVRITSLQAPAAEPENIPGGGTPAPSHNVCLSFNEKDELGAPVTPEGELKQSVLFAASSGFITSATGALSPAHGVVGMAGVGKTVALQGLAYDEDIQKRFIHGIHYLPLGQGATLQTVVREIGKIMRVAGAGTIVETVEKCSSIREAVDCAVKWFKGKICLYLVDDLWPTHDSKTGFLNDLRQLLRGSPESRMAISTRSHLIAQCAGLSVHFGARDPCGPVSVRIFLAHATVARGSSCSSDDIRQIRASMREILLLCAGLPVALSVSGSSVALLMQGLHSFERACDVYEAQLRRKTASLGDEESMGGSCLNAGILVSLEYLEIDFKKWKKKSCVAVEISIYNLYVSLCVLENQAWIPISALCRQWRLDEETALIIANRFCEMSLATLKYIEGVNSSADVPGILLHDLHLEFCRCQAKKQQSYSLWHDRLLSGFLMRDSDTDVSLEERSHFAVDDILWVQSRPWWSLAKDGYIHEHLARHLSGSGQVKELAALLTDARWMEKRADVGGILSLSDDFEILIKHLTQTDCRGRSCTSPECIAETFRKVIHVVKFSWGRLSEGFRAFQFHVCGRLHHLRKSNYIIGGFLASIEAYTPKPYLEHVVSCFHEVSKSQVMEVPVGGECNTLQWSGCGGYIVAGAGNDLVILDCASGDITHRLKCRTGLFQRIRIVAQSKTVIALNVPLGSSVGSIVTWKWEAAGSTVRCLKGHKRRIRGMTISRDGKTVFTGSSDMTLRVWDSKTGLQTKELALESEVRSLQTCGEDRKVALGLENGTVRVFDLVTLNILFEDKSAHQDVVRDVSFSLNSPLLATTSFDNTSRVWHTETWENIRDPLLRHSNRVAGCSLSPDGRTIVFFSSRTFVCDVESGSSVEISREVTEPISSAAFSPNGRNIALASFNGVVRLLSLHIAEKPETSRNTSRNSNLRSVLDICLLDDGSKLAAAMSDGTICFHDTQSGLLADQPLQEHTDSVYCVSVSPDGRQMISGSADRTLRLWSLESFRQVGDPFLGHSGLVSAVSFCHDGRRIISGYCNGTAQLWNTSTGKQIGATLQLDTRRIDDVAESSDECYIVYIHWEVVYIWSLSIKQTVWRSDFSEKTLCKISRDTISSNEAQKIVSLCGAQSAIFWKSRFEPHPGKVIYSSQKIYFCEGQEQNLVACLPSVPGKPKWDYNEKKKVFAIALKFGRLAILKVVTE